MKIKKKNYKVVGGIVDTRNGVELILIFPCVLYMR